jgi:hypothetical protein
VKITPGPIGKLPHLWRMLRDADGNVVLQGSFDSTNWLGYLHLPPGEPYEVVTWELEGELYDPSKDP